MSETANGKVDDMAVISQGQGTSRGVGGLLRRLRVGAYGSGVGVLVVAVGLLLIGLGWNGMAGGGGEINGVPNLNAQLPWLVSGGILGLALVVFGSSIVVAHNARVDRARLEAKLDDLTAAFERSVQPVREAVQTFQPAAREPRVVRTTAPAPATAKKTAKKAAPAKRATGSPRR
jgi:hypothetical protein